LDAWIEREAFKGWDPFDALNSPLLKFLTFKNRRLGQVWVQLVKNNPVNLRRVLGIPKTYNAKGMGLFLASYWRKYILTGQPAYKERALFFADWLQANSSAGYAGMGWGYPFDWPNRGFFAPAGTPTLVNTAFIGLAFLDLLAIPDPTGQCTWGDMPLQVARSACEFILRDLSVDRSSPGARAFSYTPLDQRYVHNANVLGAWLLAEVGMRSGEAELSSASLEAARYASRCQRADGSWRYGEAAQDGWVDNFHTGYVLVALKNIARCLDTTEFDDVISLGYRYWKGTFFLPDGMPKYYAGKVYPVDAHCIAQGILTFLAFSDQDPQAVQSAWRVAEWGLDRMQAPEGFFYYQIGPVYRNRIPYMRWTQAWMQRALTELAWFSKAINFQQ